MSYSRQTVCSLAGIDVDRFKVLARRGQNIAWLQEGEDGEAFDPYERRPPISGFQALLLAIQTELTLPAGMLDGLSPPDAYQIVNNNAHAVHEAVKSREPYFIGYAGDPQDGRAGGFQLFGSFAEVAAMVASKGGNPARVTLVNVSRVYQAVLDRAAVLGIEFAL